MIYQPEILLSFLATIPTYLIGIHYMAEEQNKKFKNIILIVIVLSVAMFGLVFNVKTIKDMDTIETITYLMLAISFMFTIATKVDFKEFTSDINRQKKADESRGKKEKTFSTGQKFTI